MNGKAHRSDIRLKNTKIDSDIDYLNSFYLENGKYPMFTQVLFETRTDCNRKCPFCPQAHYVRPFMSMDWRVFTKVVDELAEIEFSGRLALFMTNEPLIEPRLLEMIRYARGKSPRMFIDITTNGINLNSDYLGELFHSGLDNININDYRNDRGSFPEKISANLRKVVTDFKNNPKVNYKGRNTSDVLSNYAGIVNTGKRSLSTMFCNYPFRKLAISAEGNVILCCNDYKYRTSFGNVMTHRLEEIWNSEGINNYRHNLLNEIRDGICMNCDEHQKYTVFT